MQCEWAIATRLDFLSIKIFFQIFSCSFISLHVWKFHDSKLLLIFVSKFLVAVLYHCMFKYVLFFSPDETPEQGRNASR